MMDVLIEKDTNKLILRGNLDNDFAPLFEKNLNELKNEKGNLYVDMQDVQFVGSSCMGLLLLFHFSCKDEGRKLILVLGVISAKFFELARLDTLFNMQVNKS